MWIRCSNFSNKTKQKLDFLTGLTPIKLNIKNRGEKKEEKINSVWSVVICQTTKVIKS